MIFGIGYVLGTRAGTERDEVKMAVSIAAGFLEDRFSATAEQLRAA